MHKIGARADRLATNRCTNARETAPSASKDPVLGPPKKHIFQYVRSDAEGTWKPLINICVDSLHLYNVIPATLPLQ